MRLTFRTKLLASHVALVVAVVLIAIIALNRSLGGDLRGQLEARLEEQALGAAQWVVVNRHPERLAGRLSAVVGARVTILDRSGAVLGDSHAPPAQLAPPTPSTPSTPPTPPTPPTSIDPEVAAAQAGRVGHATREGEGAGATHHVAVPAGDGLVLRLSAPLSGIDATLRAMRARLLFASALAVTAALALGLVAARIAARPLQAMATAADRIARGDYEIRVASTSPDDFGRLAQALTSLAAQLAQRIGELTAERDRLSAILTGMVEGVLVTGRAGEVLVANPAAEALLAPPGERDRRAPNARHAFRIGLPIDVAIPLPSLRDLIARAAETGETQQAEIEPAEAAGRALATYVRPLAADAGGGVVAVLRDMTEIRRFEAMRRDFVANVSHELRTPVTAIQGYAETLLGPADEPAPAGASGGPMARQFLEIIHRNAARIGRLVEDLLRLSALEARRDPPPREAVPLGPLAEHVADTVRARPGADRAAVTLEVAPDAVALGDPAGIEEVIENLVDNAIKYGRPGGAVRVVGTRTRTRAGGGDRVQLQIIDDGPGIAPEHLPRIFERFYRVDPARSRERGGTGLGLSIVQHLVETMGGAVRVESERGEGCRFTVDLPAA